MKLALQIEKGKANWLHPEIVRKLEAIAAISDTNIEQALALVRLFLSEDGGWFVGRGGSHVWIQSVYRPGERIAMIYEVH